MILKEQLNLFYKKFDIPENGGIDHTYFEVPLPYFTLKLPNYSWRKKMLYIHDLEHILNNQDTSWQGEIFIASWEISTGFWRNFPVCIFPLWTMGWGMWYNTNSVLNGLKKGCNDRGIAGLKLEKDNLLNMNLDQLKLITINQNSNQPKFNYFKKFIFSIVISQFVFLSPFILLILLISLIFVT